MEEVCNIILLVLFLYQLFDAGRRTVARMDIRTAIEKPSGKFWEMGDAYYIVHFVICAFKTFTK